MSVETTIILTGVAVWFAHGWYLNERLKSVHQKLDQLSESFNGLREYLYEIDPQFDDERAVRRSFEQGETFAGMDDLALTRQKKEEGRRTLDTPL